MRTGLLEVLNRKQGVAGVAKKHPPLPPGEIALFGRRLKMLPAEQSRAAQPLGRGKARESCMPLSSCCAVHVGANTFR